MGIVEKAPPATLSSGTDFDRFRLRRFVESLPDSERETHDEPLDLVDVAPILEGNPRAVLFRGVGPERQELVANVAGGRTRLAHAFGVEPRGLVAEIQRRLRNKPEVFEVSRAEAPVQQVVLTSDQADLTKLPVHLGHGADGGPYISASVDFVVDPRSGLTNVGMRRLMLRGRRETGIDLVSPSDLRAIYEASAAAGKPLPVSFVVGAHPVDQVAAMMRLPVDELGLLSALRDAPLPVVKCVDQRHPRAGRCRVGAGGLSRRARARRAGRAVRRIPRLLRRAQAQPAVSPDRDHTAARCAVPDVHHRRRARSAAPTPRSSQDCAPR